jgi:hypothetical protein
VLGYGEQEVPVFPLDNQLLQARLDLFQYDGTPVPQVQTKAVVFWAAP